MSEASFRPADVATSLTVFEAELAASLPFREDVALLRALTPELAPVLSALARGYHGADPADLEATRKAACEGLALLNLLCRRAGLLGATPAAALALPRALIAALRRAGLVLSAGAADDLALLAVEGYCAGRDERGERSLREIALESQVCFMFAPGCFGLFLSGSHASEPFAAMLDERARQLFRAEARSVLLDVSRLPDASEDVARALFSFASTLVGLGAGVSLYEPGVRFDAWFARLDLAASGVERAREFGAALARTLGRAGYELRARGRLGELLDKVRTGAR